LTTKGNLFYIDEVLWSLVWGMLFLLNGVFGRPFVQSALTDILVFVFVISFLLGHKFAVIQDGPIRDRSAILLPKIGIFVIFCSVVGMISPYELYKHGPGDANIQNFSSYAGTAQEVNGDVRTGLVEQTLTGKIAFSASQAGLIIVGTFAAMGRYPRRKRVFLTTVAAAPLIVFTVVSTIRSALFMAVLLLVVGSISGLTALGRERTLFSTKRMVGVTSLVATMALVMFFFQSIRMGDLTFSRSAKTLEHLRIWIAGYIPALNSWLWGAWDHRLTFGASSFRFLKAMIQGNTSYLATFQSNMYIGNHVYGNASTMLRTNINDFGLIGCGVFMFFWGAISRFLVSKTRQGSAIFALLFTCDLAAIVWSPNAWFFMYGSRLMAPALAIGYVLMRRIRITDTRLGTAQGSVLYPGSVR
jgi:oligosaccharide repeat unit polymerase